MMRYAIAAGLLAGVTLAGAALAEPKVTTGADGQACMSADLGIVPAKVRYSNGYIRTLLGQFGNVVVSRNEGPNFQPFEYRAKFSIFPLLTDTTGRDSVWDWTTDLPNLYVIEANGETFHAEGTRTMTDGEPVPVSVDITVLGREVVEFNGCPYEVMQLKLEHGESGKKVSETFTSYDPELWTSFRTEQHPLDGSAGEVIEPIEFVTTR